MTSIGGVGERLALIAGGALALALVQLLRAKREGNSREGSNLGTGRAHSINTAEVRLTYSTYICAMVVTALFSRKGLCNWPWVLQGL